MCNPCMYSICVSISLSLIFCRSGAGHESHPGSLPLYCLAIIEIKKARDSMIFIHFPTSVADLIKCRWTMATVVPWVVPLGKQWWVVAGKLPASCRSSAAMVLVKPHPLVDCRNTRKPSAYQCIFTPHNESFDLCRSLLHCFARSQTIHQASGNGGPRTLFSFPLLSFAASALQWLPQHHCILHGVNMGWSRHMPAYSA